MMKKKVLIIGIDGARQDCVEKADTPNLNKLMANGIFSTDAMTEWDSVSGACWTALLKGVHKEKHGINGNDFSTMNPKYKTIYHLAKEHNPDYKIVAFSSWYPIIEQIFGKEILAEESNGSDKTCAWRLRKAIEANSADLYFIQFDELDGAGHTHTYSLESKKYMKKIVKTDKLLTPILDAIDNRINENGNEDWLICVVSDHGGNNKGHGGVTYGELNIVYIISGNSVKNSGKIPYNEEEDEEGTLMPKIVDMAATIANFLELPTQEYWDGTNRAKFI